MTTLGGDGRFLSDSNAGFVDATGNGEVDYEYESRLGGSVVSTLVVGQLDGSTWTARLTVPTAMSRRALTGVFGTPDPGRLCVVVCGVVFLIDTRNPSDVAELPIAGPVVCTESLVGDSYLLLATPWDVSAIGVEGLAWTSRRIAIEGLQIDESADGWIRGVADPDDEPREFAVELSTGRVVGGVDLT